MHVWNVLHAAGWKYRTQKWRKKSLSGHYRTTLSGYIFATKARIDNRKKLVKQQYLVHMLLQYGELRLISGWDRFVSLGYPSKFQRVSRLGFVTAAPSLQVQRKPTKLCTMFGRLPRGYTTWNHGFIDISAYLLSTVNTLPKNVLKISNSIPGSVVIVPSSIFKLTEETLDFSLLLIMLIPRLHDTTGCQTGCTTGSTSGCIV